MLMSLDTSTTSRGACCSRSACTTPRIWLSALPCGRLAGRLLASGLGLEEQAAAGLAVAGGVELQAAGDVGALGAGQGVQRAAGLAGVAGDFRHALLVAVELFQHDHRQEDVVFLEAEQAHRVVHEHVGVQHEQLGRAGGLGLACGPRRGLGLDGALLVGAGFGLVERRSRCRRGTLPDGRSPPPARGSKSRAWGFSASGLSAWTASDFRGALCEERAGAS